MITRINPWTIGIPFLIGVVSASYYWTDRIDEIKTKGRLEKQKIELVHAHQIAELNQKLHLETKHLKEKFNEELSKTIEQKDDAIMRVRNSELRLRDKYARCQSQGKGDSAGASTGGSTANESAFLSRETSEFLVGFASDADKTLAALRACVTQYNQVKFELENSKK